MGILNCGVDSNLFTITILLRKAQSPEDKLGSFMTKGI